jgi:hypothetical protein
MANLDEAIFAVPNVLNFQADLILANGTNRLSITLHCDPNVFTDTLADVHEALARVPSIAHAVAQGRLAIDPIRLSAANWFSTGASKRTLIDRRQEIKRPCISLPKQPVDS